MSNPEAYVEPVGADAVAELGVAVAVAVAAMLASVIPRFFMVALGKSGTSGVVRGIGCLVPFGRVPFQRRLPIDHNRQFGSSTNYALRILECFTKIPDNKPRISSGLN